jgi:hypothetical protein
MEKARTVSRQVPAGRSMNLAVLSLLSVLSTSPAEPGLRNLDFATGRLTHWEGAGFCMAPGRGQGPCLRFGICSADAGKPGRTALLYRAFVVPPGTGAIVFTAAAIRPRGVPATGDLDVLLETAGRKYQARQERSADGWTASPRIAPLDRGPAREYRWVVSALGGQLVRILLVDRDARPDCSLFCTGFRLVPQEEMERQDFREDMRRLARDHRLAPAGRYESRHFMAFSSADEEFTRQRLINGETIYVLFFEHFRKRGFEVREPPGKLMVAIFDEPAGFEAYLGQKVPAAVTGVYHLRSNRLVTYDYARNRSFLAQRQRRDEILKQLPQGPSSQVVLGALAARLRDERDDTNTGTIVHEVAHQLSFNGGLLNRDGDIPLWLAEGLACYCEPTWNGSWQGLGAPNPHRALALAGAAAGRGSFLPLRALVSSDAWLQRTTSIEQALLGYAQSWALFRMLLEERPRELRSYLRTIHARRTPDHRLTDFGAAFGADLARLEQHYHAYIRELVRQQVRPAP